MPWMLPAAMLASTAVNYMAGDSAADAQSSAARDSNATNKAMYDQTRADNMPALESRNWALQQLRGHLGGALGQPVLPQNVQNEAGFQFGLQQGQNALNSQLTARGMRNSGAALKAVARYANDYGSTKYGEAFNREMQNRNAILNPLQSMAQLGQSGASTIAGAGQGYAGNVSQTQASLGNALGANALYQGNALANGINQLGGWYANQQKAPTNNWANGLP